MTKYRQRHGGFGGDSAEQFRAEVQKTLIEEQALVLTSDKLRHRCVAGALKFAGLTPDLYGESNTRFCGGCATWNDYLIQLRLLPELIAHHHNFYPMHLDQVNAYIEWMYEYIVLAEWLDFLVPGDKPMPPELFFTEKINAKPSADLSKCVLDLCVELLPRSAELQERFTTPAEIWFAWESARLDLRFTKSGFLSGKPAPEFLGSKESAYENMRGFAKWLEEANRLTLPGGRQAGQKRVGIEEFIPLLAASIASRDTGFRLSKAYRDFHKQLKRIGRCIRQPGVRSAYFVDGQMILRGRNAPRASRKISNL